ncbi:MAG: type II secretion system major pseudopilin GspG [Oligoflexia bacterium]|nr:type II secretion system major pseudopilin GspG [Oligoflexia bacterium]
MFNLKFILKSHPKLVQAKLLQAKLLKGNAGFSLMEILIALTILGIAGTFAASMTLERLHEGKVQSTIIQLQNLKARLQEYRRHCGNYPTTEQGLDALIKKPTAGPECKRYASSGYIEGGEVPKDPFDNDFAYESDGKSFTITSYGDDGAPAGEDKAKDFSVSDRSNAGAASAGAASDGGNQPAPNSSNPPASSGQ